MNEFLASLNEAEYIFAVFMLMFANGLIGLPPSELVLSLTGYHVAINNSNIFVYVFASVLGNLIGTYIVFVLVRAIVSKIDNSIWQQSIIGKTFRKIIAIYSGKLSLKHKIDHIIEKYGLYSICTARCIPSIRFFIAVPAALSSVGHLQYIILSLIGISIWSIVWIVTSYYYGMIIYESRGLMRTLLIGIIFIFTLFYFIYVKLSIKKSVIRREE